MDFEGINGHLKCPSFMITYFFEKTFARTHNDSSIFRCLPTECRVTFPTTSFGGKVGWCIGWGWVVGLRIKEDTNIVHMQKCRGGSHRLPIGPVPVGFWVSVLLGL